MREAMQSQMPLSRTSGALRNLALELGRIANDLRLLSSGPTTGLAEIREEKVNTQILCLLLSQFQIGVHDGGQEGSWHVVLEVCGMHHAGSPDTDDAYSHRIHCSALLANKKASRPCDQVWDVVG